MLRDLVQQEQFFLEVSLARVEHFLGFFVGEAAVGVGHRTAEPTLADGVRFRIHSEDGTEGQLVFVGAQATELVGDAFGQHGADTVHEINTGGSGGSLLVQCTTGANVVGNIGDVYTDFQLTVFEYL